MLKNDDLTTIQLLLESHRRMEDHIERYHGLVNDLHDDFCAITSNSRELYYLVDYTILQDRLLPLLAGRHRLVPRRSYLLHWLKEAVWEMKLVHFFFNLEVNKVLLKVYAHEYKESFIHLHEIADHHGWDNEDRGSELWHDLARRNLYFALWEKELTEKPTLDTLQAVRSELSEALSRGQEVFSHLVDDTASSRLFSLTEALGAADLESISVDEFQVLHDYIQDRSYMSVERDIEAAAITRALNAQFGSLSVARPHVGDQGSTSIRPSQGKRFILVTKDRQLVRGLQELRHVMTIPSLTGCTTKDVTSTRSLLHLYLLFLCWIDTQVDGKTDIWAMNQWLSQKHSEIENYLVAVREAQAWVGERNQELQSPGLRSALESHGIASAASEPVNFPELRRKLEEFAKSESFSYVMSFSSRETGIASFDVPKALPKPRIVRREDFKQAVNQLDKGAGEIASKSVDPLEEFAVAKERLDVIIALFGTPVWNRYLGFNYVTKHRADHPLASQMGQISDLLAARMPTKTANALELLFDLRRQSKVSRTFEVVTRFQPEIDGYFNALLSKAYRIQGRYSESIRVCDRVLFLWNSADRPESVRTVADEAEIVFERGLSLKALRGKYRQQDAQVLARSGFERAYELDPQDARFVYELAVAVSREAVRNLDESLVSHTRDNPNDMFHSSGLAVECVRSYRKEIEKADVLLSRWLDGQTQRSMTSEVSKEEASLRCLVENGRAYCSWLLTIQRIDILRKDEVLQQTTETSLLHSLSLAREALIRQRTINERAESVRLSILETCIQILLSVLEVRVLRTGLDLALLDELEAYLAEFKCTPEFQRCHREVQEEYSKFRRLYVLPSLSA